MNTKDKEALESARQKAREAQEALWALGTELLELKQETERKMQDIYSRINRIAVTLGK